MRPLVLASALLALLLGSGCASLASATRPATRAIGELVLSPQDELRIGNQLASQVRQQEKVLEDPQVQSYVNTLGQRLVAQVPGKERPFDFHFTVIDAPDNVNAFALPGGHIFVYSGLIRAASNEAELASVLGHEVAHVASGHARQQLASQVGLGTLQQLLLGNDPHVLAQLGSAIASQGYLAAYTRGMESEADKRGLQYLDTAGYDPAAMARFFDKLGKLEGSKPNFVSSFFATHPNPGARAREVSSLIESRGYGGGQEAIVSSDFQNIQARVGGPVR
ncbi:M48 family metalloprotease [Archangium violaceum]|uniref:M48 family metallopeptidase n=1 Tax=Archangium violaceum TaxID=83451 RepID=UPI0019524E64|nr:M48 family metallopeptidase [Archangium violaceum]QRN96197.1 M48 family metalloprotease [Archangium violaceum]